jgi:hypothetical protein
MYTVDGVAYRLECVHGTKVRNVILYIFASKSHIHDLTTVPYIGDDSMVQRLFRKTALPDGGPVGAETCRSFVNYSIVVCAFVRLICNNYITMHEVGNVK